ncbi:helix-hairpin-helix domain-containing protein [Streptomyces sp. NPDC050732]|uniref:helix-hairpin-helix domain-containing protein n=1 Tax=Streptomyces sp. NPDC050732 TaxID=3154632 RepID=UPI00341A03AB
MAIRSLSRTASATSGPGRAPASDGRANHRQARERARRRRASAASAASVASAEAVRLRAESLFAEPQPPPQTTPSRPSPRSPRLDVAAADAEPVGGAPVGGGSVPRAPMPVPGWAREAEAKAEVGEPPDAEVEPRSGPSRRERMGLALRERLPVWLQSRCGLERRGVVALVVVLAVAAVFAAQHFWSGRTQPVRPPEVVRAAGAAADRDAEPVPSPGPPAQAGRAAESGGGAGGPGGAAAAGGPAGVIVVDVSGKVRRPGVHRLPAGSRVADALRAAGGVRPGTKTDGLNRARFLMDGEQVVVGAAATAGGASAGAGAAGAGAAAGVGGAAGAAGGGGAAATGPIGLNTATAEQLDELPGVGPVLAQHILDYRAEHGGFRTVEELREVNGIGDRRFADIQDLVRP